MRPGTRLDALEQRARAIAGEPLIVLYELDSGEQRTGTVDTMLADGGDFCRVIDGSSLTDLDKILAAFHAADIMDRGNT